VGSRQWAETSRHKAVGGISHLSAYRAPQARRSALPCSSSSPILPKDVTEECSRLINGGRRSSGPPACRVVKHSFILGENPPIDAAGECVTGDRSIASSAHLKPAICDRMMAWPSGLPRRETFIHPWRESTDNRSGGVCHRGVRRPTRAATIVVGARLAAPFSFIFPPVSPPVFHEF
jgi:hypothetical protein